MKRLTVALALCLAAAGCGAPPKTEPAGAVQTEIAELASKEPGAADIKADPTQAPALEAAADEVFLVRIASPKTTLSNLQRLLSGRLSAISPEILLMGIVGPAQADVVDSAGPMDAIAFDEQWSRVALSLPVRQRFAGHLDDVFELRERKGMRVVKGVRVAVSDDVHAMLPACGFATDAANGTRLLCATSDELLDQVSSYLARVLAPQPLGADARVEFSVPRLLALMPPDKQDEEEGPGERAGRELGKQFLQDIERVAVSGTWRSTALDVEHDLVASSRRSVFTRVLTTNTGAGGPPPSFFRLPLDASVAFYTQGATASDLEPLRDEFLNAAYQDMIEEGHDKDLLDQILNKIRTLLFTGGPFVTGAGMNRAAAEKALVSLHDGKHTPQAVEEARRSLASWVVIGLEEPPERWIGGVREFLRLDQALTRKLAQGGAATKPPGPAGAAPGKHTKKKDRKERTELVEVAAPATLPKGTLHLESRAKPIAKDGPLPHTEHIYVVADGSRTWIGIGGRDADIIDRLRIVLRAPAEKTLAAAAGIEPIKVSGALAGGFFTLAGAGMMFQLNNDKESDLEVSRVELEKLAALPARGDSLIPWLILPEPGSAGAMRTRMQMRLPLDALTDIVQLVR